jgi:hypothetical protein
MHATVKVCGTSERRSIPPTGTLMGTCSRVRLCGQVVRKTLHMLLHAFCSVHARWRVQKESWYTRMLSTVCVDNLEQLVEIR